MAEHGVTGSPTEPLSVVVIGGGFAGLEACKELTPAVRKGLIRLTLIDKENFFQFNPLLVEVATGAVETRHIVYPLRSFCIPRGIRFVRNKLRMVDVERRVLVLHNQLEVPYDRLIIAAGSSTNYFGIPGAESCSFPFKTLMDAIRLRAHNVEMWELADQAESSEKRRELLTFVVAGGGITGVEICAELVHLFRHTMSRLYPEVPQSLVSVYLVEAGARLLPPAVRDAHAEIAEGHLRQLGVNIVLNRRVVSVDEDRVQLDDGQVIPAHTLIWTTGVRGQTLEAPWPWPLGRAGRLKVDAGLKVAEGVWAAGDAADVTDREGRAVPMVAQGAIQSGKVAAQNLLAELGAGQATQLLYRDLGYFVGLGKRSTIASILGVPVAGWLAWYLWAAAYLFKMVGLRKQIEVGLDILKTLLVEHDTSQIHDRRRMLRPRDLDPVLTRPEEL